MNQTLQLTSTVLLLALTLLSGCSKKIEAKDTSQPIDRLSETNALASLTKHAEQLYDEDLFSGAILIAGNGKVLLRKAWGLENREDNLAVSIDTKFRLGSMNKIITAIATLQLVETGILSLDDTVGKHLVNYPNKGLASRVTIRHLLTHTGGTGDIFGPDFVQNIQKLKTHSDYLDLYGSRELTHEPGARYKYSNYGFVLLGAIIEELSGMSYYQFVRKNIFIPAEMHSSGSLPENENVLKRAVPYGKTERGWISAEETLPWRGMAAGGGYSTVDDLWRFTQALDSGILISKSLFAEATKSQFQQYGYGFYLSGEYPLHSYGHDGGAPGMSATFQVFPELGYVIIILSNFDYPVTRNLANHFIHRMPMKTIQ